jgi:hypothetical protein
LLSSLIFRDGSVPDAPSRHVSAKLDDAKAVLAIDLAAHRRQFGFSLITVEGYAAQCVVKAAYVFAMVDDAGAKSLCIYLGLDRHTAFPTDDGWIRRRAIFPALSAQYIPDYHVEPRHALVPTDSHSDRVC